MIGQSYQLLLHLMKPIEYPDNGNGLHVSYHRMREGPNYFLVYYKQSSVLRQDPKDAWRVMGVAKFTDKAKELKQWCLDMQQQYVLDKLEPVPDQSFASEALEEEPNDNTKMIT